MTIYKITKEIYLDTYDKTYYHIFVISPSIESNDSLFTYLRHIPYKKLSPFDYPSISEEIHHCKQGILHPTNKNKYLEIKNTEILFNLLLEHKYKIEYEMTKILKDSKNHMDSKIVCYASK